NLSHSRAVTTDWIGSPPHTAGQPAQGGGARDRPAVVSGTRGDQRLHGRLALERRISTLSPPVPEHECAPAGRARREWRTPARLSGRADHLGEESARGGR